VWVGVGSLGFKSTTIGNDHLGGSKKKKEKEKEKEEKEKEKEEKGEKKRIQLALHLEIYIQPFRNILTPFRNLVISKYHYLPRIDLLDKVAWIDMYVVEFNQARAGMCIERQALPRSLPR